jgi:hypothetical protein
MLGFEAGCFYYVKCTVSVPSFFRENPRSAQFFTFVPIEPPRPSMDGECYARRQHTFTEDAIDQERWRRKLSGIMSRNSRDDPASPATSNFPPVRITIDARIPNPPVLTCGAPVPLRLLVTQQSKRMKALFLQSLQVEIIGFTTIRASDVRQTKTTSWVITSKSNLHQAIGSPDDPEGKITELDNSFWKNFRLPDTICPSFVTCNISRRYELSVTIGLTYGSTQPGMVNLPSLSYFLDINFLSRQP